MNILFVNDIPFNPIGGGIERVTDVLAKELLRRGYTVSYLCGKLSSSQFYLLDYDFPAQLYQLPCQGLFHNNENIAYYKRLQSELKIDIVINQRGLVGCFNSLLPITHVKLVSVLHSTPESYVRASASIDNLIRATVPPFMLLKKIVKKTFFPIVSCYWKKKALDEHKILYNELAQGSDAIVTLSKNDIELLNDFIATPHKCKITSISNPNTFSVINMFSQSKERTILYVGRLTKVQKEPLRMLMIWKYLHEKHPDWCLKIVGDGDEKNKMMDYVEAQHLHHVFFEGRQSDVASYYKKASFVCLTSDFEGWGMVLTEGMQYGCIPFTFNNYGAAYDIIDDGVNGCLIPAFDLKKYATRLSKLMSDEDKRVEMSKAAIEKVKKFSVENVGDKWEELFRSLK